MSAPYWPGRELDAHSFHHLRRTMLLEHCKWDPQVGDSSTLAKFPLLMAEGSWRQLATWAEALAAEASTAEAELASRPELHRELGLPRQLRRAFSAADESSSEPALPRALRFDFHWTREGWRISECNADVPGGYAEASAFTALMARHYQDARVAGDPGAVWALALCKVAKGADVALLAAPGFMEDQQVIRYLAKRLAEQGVVAHCVQPMQLEWSGKLCRFAGRTLGAVLRFYQAEWLPKLPRSTQWWRYLGDADTPVLNPGTSILIESKRFPLVWGALRSTRLEAWRELLPTSADPRRVPWDSDDGWLLKTALCNTGDTVSIKSLMSKPAWANSSRRARWSPGDWVAQRRFDALPLETSCGPVYPCIGVYTIEGRACGAYARLSHRPVVDYAAIDVALLIQDSGNVAIA